MKDDPGNINQLLEKYFPEDNYYTQIISPNYSFGANPFLNILSDLRETSDLAQCLTCIPDAFVLHRTVPPKNGALFVKFFQGDIKLEPWEVEIYKQYYPKLILLYSPLTPQYIFFPDFVEGKPAENTIFEIQF